MMKLLSAAERHVTAGAASTIDDDPHHQSEREAPHKLDTEPEDEQPPGDFNGGCETRREAHHVVAGGVDRARSARRSAMKRS